MKPYTCLLFSLLVFFTFGATVSVAQQSSVGGGSYKNPLPVKLGDPYVLYANSCYYLYGTGARFGFPAYKSADMMHWQSLGQVYTCDTNTSWANGSFWAPEVYKVKNKYYMFFSAQWKTNPTAELENFRIGIAVADKPEGPFVDLSVKPVFDPGYPIIDADVFFDNDGKVFLYYSRCCYKHAVASELAALAKKKGWYNEIEESWVYGIELKPDFSGVLGEPQLLLRPPATLKDKQAEWESRSVTTREINRRWTEGSVTFKKDNVYYMMYSANNFAGQNYAVGYATATAPLGPYTKALNNPVLQKNIETGGTVSGTGHNNILWSPDKKEMFCVYHARTNATGNDRVVFIDRMHAEKGKITIDGPTITAQAVPSGLKVVTGK